MAALPKFHQDHRSWLDMGCRNPAYPPNTERWACVCFMCFMSHARVHNVCIYCICEKRCCPGWCCFVCYALALHPLIHVTRTPSDSHRPRRPLPRPHIIVWTCVHNVYICVHLVLPTTPPHPPTLFTQSHRHTHHTRDKCGVCDNVTG